jgi:hypothetical protein
MNTTTGKDGSFVFILVSPLFYKSCIHVKGWMVGKLPSLNELTDALERFSVEALCQVIGSLTLSLDLVNLNGAVTNMTPKEMPLHKKILCSIRDSLLCCQEQGTIVVFKHAANDG